MNKAAGKDLAVFVCKNLAFRADSWYNNNIPYG
ncbi:unknown [Ruminococcus sp. CAG:579]|nr:unknown [Ruminococcus sp. CAG:579]